LAGGSAESGATESAGVEKTGKDLRTGKKEGVRVTPIKSRNARIFLTEMFKRNTTCNLIDFAKDDVL